MPTGTHAEYDCYSRINECMLSPTNLYKPKNPTGLIIANHSTMEPYMRERERAHLVNITNWYEHLSKKTKKEYSYHFN